MGGCVLYCFKVGMFKLLMKKMKYFLSGGLNIFLRLNINKESFKYILIN